MPFETHRQITVEANVAGGYIDTGNINVSINLPWMLSDQLCLSSGNQIEASYINLCDFTMKAKLMLVVFVLEVHWVPERGGAEPFLGDMILGWYKVITSCNDIQRVYHLDSNHQITESTLASMRNQ